MSKNEQELKKEIRVENKRSSDNLNQVTVGFSKIVGLNEFLTCTFHIFGATAADDLSPRVLLKLAEESSKKTPTLHHRF